jgi:hypothetical protein
MQPEIVPVGVSCPTAAKGSAKLNTKTDPGWTAANATPITPPNAALLARGMLYRVESQNRELYPARGRVTCTFG